MSYIVTIQKDRSGAIQTAQDAAAHISTPKDTQCNITSDASLKAREGGVGQAFKPWVPGQHEEIKSFVSKASHVSHICDIQVLETLAVSDALCVAVDEIERELGLKHIESKTTVVVKITTDSQEALRMIARDASPRNTHKAKLCRLIVDLIKAKSDEIQNLGVDVKLQFHWSPRNQTLQHKLADGLAKQARLTGRSHCSTSGNNFSYFTESTTMRFLKAKMGDAFPAADLIMTKKQRSRLDRATKIPDTTTAPAQQPLPLMAPRKPLENSQEPSAAQHLNAPQQPTRSSKRIAATKSAVIFTTPSGLRIARHESHVTSSVPPTTMVEEGHQSKKRRGRRGRGSKGRSYTYKSYITGEDDGRRPLSADDIARYDQYSSELKKRKRKVNTPSKLSGQGVKRQKLSSQGSEHNDGENGGPTAAIPSRAKKAWTWFKQLFVRQ